jgi:hypothetical protein
MFITREEQARAGREEEEVTISHVSKASFGQGTGDRIRQSQCRSAHAGGSVDLGLAAAVGCV